MSPRSRRRLEQKKAPREEQKSDVQETQMRGRRELPAEGDGDKKRLERQRELTLKEIEAERDAEAKALQQERRRRPAVFFPGQRRQPQIQIDQQFDPVLRIPSVTTSMLSCGCPPDHPHQFEPAALVNGDGAYKVPRPPRCTVPGCPHFLETRWDGPDSANEAPCVFRFSGASLRGRVSAMRVEGVPEGVCGIPRSEHTRQNGLFHPFEPLPDAARSGAGPAFQQWARDAFRISDAPTTLGGVNPLWEADYDDTSADAVIEPDVDIQREDEPSQLTPEQLDSLIRQGVTFKRTRFVNPSLDRNLVATNLAGLAWAFGSSDNETDLRIHLALQSVGVTPVFSMCGLNWRTLDARTVLRGDLCPNCLASGTLAGRIAPA